MTFGAAAAVLAVVSATAVVLRDVMAYDRPPAPRPEPAPPPEPARPPEPVPPLPAEGSMLAAITTTETDEHSPLRRVGALAVLLTVTLLFAVVVAAGIYKGVSAFK